VVAAEDGSTCLGWSLRKWTEREVYVAWAGHGRVDVAENTPARK